MNELVAKCGATCSQCPSYKDYIANDADRQRASDYWHAAFGFRISPKSVIACDGCQTTVDEPSLYYSGKGCNIRRCAIMNGAQTCAHCSGYRCGALKGNHNYVPQQEVIQERLGDPVPDQFKPFIVKHPKTQLDRVRADLTPVDFVEMHTFGIQPRIKGFPSDLPYTPDKISALKSLHHMIAYIGKVDGISYADKSAAQQTRRNLLKLLLTFGLHGVPDMDNDCWLTLDAQSYLNSKIHSNFGRVKGYIAALAKYHMRIEHVATEDDGWLTPTGALRRHDWYLKLTFDHALGSRLIIDALQIYAVKLQQLYGKNAFRYFSRADMQVLSDHID